MDLFKIIKLSKNKVVIVDKEDFNWLSNWKWHYVGSNCGAGRWDIVNGEKKHILMHRSILKKHDLLKKNLETDHINRNVLDNRKVNLRMVTHRENSFNRGLHKNNKSGYKGVFFDKQSTNKYKKWRASININGKFINLGRFLTKEKAAFAYNIAARNYFGELTYFNLIGE